MKQHLRRQPPSGRVIGRRAFVVAGLAGMALAPGVRAGQPIRPAGGASPSLVELGRAIRALHPRVYAVLLSELARRAPAPDGVPALSVLGWRLAPADLHACVAALERQRADVD